MHEIRAGHGVLRGVVVRRRHKKKKNQAKSRVSLGILEPSLYEEDLDKPRYGYSSLVSHIMLCEKLVSHRQGETGKQTKMNWSVLLTHKPTDG